MTSNENGLHPTAKSFLKALNLPRDYPYSHLLKKTGQERGLDSFLPSKETNPFFFAESPTYRSWDPNRSSLIDTARLAASTTASALEFTGPSILSFFHLCFLRLFCPVIYAISLAYLLCSNSRKHPKRAYYLDTFAGVVALLMAMTMMTDAPYVLEYSQLPLVCLFLLTAALVLCKLPPRTALWVVLPTSCGALFLLWTCNLDLPSNQGLIPGLYYDSSHATAREIVQHWPLEKRTYDQATPWLVTGDTRTGVPYLLNHISEPHYVRRWVPSQVPDETEAVILDIAFPPDGIHRIDKPIYLILHGLNGGSKEEYVKDFVQRRTREGSTVAVMVTRGLMDSPMVGENLLHFARTSDIDATATALKAATAESQVLAGVGYSMGAICLANYVARAGPKVHLDAAVALSGALDTRLQLIFHRSERLWQPLLASALRDTMTSKFHSQLQERLTVHQIARAARAESIVALDKTLFVPYNNFTDIHHYYSEMGAMGDWISFDGAPEDVGRIGNVSIPLLNVHALDDPIGSPACLRDPEKLSHTANGNIFVLVTEKGGHVGWPLGWNPAKEGWRWQSDVASSFVESVQHATQLSLGALTN